MLKKLEAPFWTLSLEQLFEILETDPSEGLSDEKVSKRQMQFGLNYFLPGSDPDSLKKWGKAKQIQPAIIPEEQKITVRRNGKQSKVAYSQLVPGDIIFFNVQDARIPCDARLIHAKDLEVSDTVLTGCASYSKKDASVTLPKDAKRYLDEIVNMVFAQSDIKKGEGMALVVATGKNTEIFKMSMPIR